MEFLLKQIVTTLQIKHRFLLNHLGSWRLRFFWWTDFGGESSLIGFSCSQKDLNVSTLREDGGPFWEFEILHKEGSSSKILPRDNLELRRQVGTACSSINFGKHSLENETTVWERNNSENDIYQVRWTPFSSVYLPDAENLCADCAAAINYTVWDRPCGGFFGGWTYPGTFRVPRKNWTARDSDCSSGKLAFAFDSFSKPNRNIISKTAASRLRHQTQII